MQSVRCKITAAMNFIQLNILLTRSRARRRARVGIFDVACMGCGIDRWTSAIISLIDYTGKISYRTMLIFHNYIPTLINLLLFFNFLLFSCSTRCRNRSKASTRTRAADNMSKVALPRVYEGRAEELKITGGNLVIPRSYYTSI